MAQNREKRSTDLDTLLRRAHGINSAARMNDMQQAESAPTVPRREEKMAQIMTVQLEKLEELSAVVNLLKSGYGHIDTKVEKIQADLSVLQARRGNDAALSQTDTGAPNQGPKDKIMVDQGRESSDSDESEDDSRGERIKDMAAYRPVHPFFFKKNSSRPADRKEKVERNQYISKEAECQPLSSRKFNNPPNP